MDPLKRLSVPFARITLITPNTTREIERHQVRSNGQVVRKELLHFSHHLAWHAWHVSTSVVQSGEWIILSPGGPDEPHAHRLLPTAPVATA